MRLRQSRFTGSSHSHPPAHVHRLVSFASTRQRPQIRLLHIHQTTSTSSSHSPPPYHVHRIVSFASTRPCSQNHLIRIHQTTSTVPSHSHPLFVNRKFHSDGFQPASTVTPWKIVPSGCFTDHYCINVNFLVRNALKVIPSIRHHGKDRKHNYLEEKDNVLNLHTVNNNSSC